MNVIIPFNPDDARAEDTSDRYPEPNEDSVGAEAPVLRNYVPNTRESLSALNLEPMRPRGRRHGPWF